MCGYLSVPSSSTFSASSRIYSALNHFVSATDLRLTFRSIACAAHRQFGRLTSVNPKSRFDDYFRYTSGRWVWDEQQQLHARYRKFNVPELQHVAAASVGARECISMAKLAEGSFNKVFRLVMDNGKAVIARIPNPNAGPDHYTLASEVATMDFVRTVLEIPVPEVYAWSARADNPVGTEYIIMAEAVGRQIADSWHTLELEDKVAVMKELISIEKKLLSVSFSRYGSLYYKGDAMQSFVNAEIIGDMSPETRNGVSKRFSIGPTTDKEFWSKERSEMDVDRGPWNDPHDYISAIALRELSWISSYAVPKAADDPLVTSAAQNSPSEHILLLKKYLAVALYLVPKDLDLNSSTLWHKDLHSGNVFVEGNRITSIIDWQGTWAGPLFLQARHPQLIDYDGEVLLKFPENFKDMEDDEKIRLRKQVAISIILHLYELNTAKENPRLNKGFRDKVGRIRTQPIMFAGDTWDDNILPLRESLINVERYWSELGFDLPCPIHFSEDEIQSHRNDADGWNEVQDFWKSVAGLVSRDGWTHPDTYDEAVAFFAELRETGLKVMVGEDRAIFEQQTRWAHKSTEPVELDQNAVRSK